MWYDAIVEFGYSYWKNGVSIGMLGTMVYLALKVRKIKKILKRFLPFLFDNDNENSAFVESQKTIMDNQQVIMDNQRLIMQHMGVEGWHAERKSLSSFTENRSFKLSLREIYTVRLAMLFTKIQGIFPTRGRYKMKKWFKPDALSAYGVVLIAAVSRYFGIEIDPANLIAAAVLLIGYFKVHELITVVRDANGLLSGFRFNSRKLIFTAVAFLCVVLDELFKFGLSAELLITVAAAVTGINYLETKKDVKQAEAEGADARQTY